MSVIRRLLDQPAMRWYDPFFPITIVLGIAFAGYC